MSYQPQWDGRSGYGGKRKHTLRNILVALLAVCVLLFAALEVFIYRQARSAGSQTGPGPQVMVIFGCQARPEGPSILLQDRLDTALDYLEDYPDMTVVVTGGKGDNEHQSEAQAMRDYLREKGFQGPVLMEDQSVNTWQNICYTRDLLREAGVEAQGYVLVSNGFHLARIRMLWNRAWGGGSALATLAAPVSHVPSAIQMFFREPLALVKSFVLDR